jgi:hypothetical protein
MGDIHPGELKQLGAASSLGACACRNGFQGLRIAQPGSRSLVGKADRSFMLIDIVRTLYKRTVHKTVLVMCYLSIPHELGLS